LELRLAEMRDNLKLVEARYEAGLETAAVVRDARVRVEFIAAELAGASDRSLLEIRLKAAREAAVEIESSYQAGLVDDLTAAEVRDQVRLLEALLADDVIAPFAIDVERLTRRLANAQARFDAGLTDRRFVQSAQVNLSIAQRRLEKMQQSLSVNPGSGVSR
jgi:outer membrane protein TolC